MRKSGKKYRDIKFLSTKNGGEVLLVHSDQARKYARKLEEDPNVKSYSVCKALSPERINMIQKVDIRKAYFEQQWESDFYVVYSDTSVGIREIATEEDLKKRAEIEKLELSRRYWKAAGVTNWKIVIVGGTSCSSK